VSTARLATSKNRPSTQLAGSVSIAACAALGPNPQTPTIPDR